MRCIPIFPQLCKPWNEEEPLFSFDLQLFAEGEKTEEPTAKKRADARKKGQVGKSQELNTGFVLLIAFFVIKMLWEHIYSEIYIFATYIYSHLVQNIDTETLLELFLEIILLLLKTVFPIMFAVLLTGLAINFYQVGLQLNTEAIGFKLSKLNPINGFGRIFSKRSLVELAKSLFKIAIIGFF